MVSNENLEFLPCKKKHTKRIAPPRAIILVITFLRGKAFDHVAQIELQDAKI
jgi:hypothetical protein